MVEKVWKDLGENQEEILPIEKFGGDQSYVCEIGIKVRERLALRLKAKAD